MSEFGEQMVFRKLLERHERVQIPKIQRDYAQGRVSAGEVRTEFLKALSHALKLPKRDPSLPLNLDFVYGSVEGDNDTKFLPLDGQQRLTTLFLIHWYAAWSNECLGEFRDWIAPNSESLFTYDVRPTSEDFFDALVRFDPEEAPIKETVISALIKNQPWYFRYWRLDPTIQSVLTCSMRYMQISTCMKTCMPAF